MKLKEISFFELADILGNIDSVFKDSWPVSFIVDNGGKQKKYEKGIFSIDDVYGGTEIYCGEVLICDGHVLHIDFDTDLISMDHDIIPMLLECCDINGDSKIYLSDDSYISKGEVLSYDDVDQFEGEFTLSDDVLARLRNLAEDDFDPKVWLEKNIKKLKVCVEDLNSWGEEEKAKTFEKIIESLEKFR